MTTTLRFAALAAALAFSCGAHSADLDSGKKKVQETCQACHGMDGLSAISPEYPKLAGQHSDYLAKALRDYKSGARKHPVMGAMAAGLTPKDIDNLAAYFAAQGGPLHSTY